MCTHLESGNEAKKSRNEDLKLVGFTEKVAKARFCSLILGN